MVTNAPPITNVIITVPFENLPKPNLQDTRYARGQVLRWCLIDAAEYAFLSSLYHLPISDYFTRVVRHAPCSAVHLTRHPTTTYVCHTCAAYYTCSSILQLYPIASPAVAAIH